MDHLRCVVERITYQNETNGYTVIKCRAKNYNDLVTVVGSMPDVHVGSVLQLTGAWRIDPKYGRQFSMETFEETLPATVFGIEKYLGSGLIKGIDPKFAKKIVQEFGKDTLDVIETDPDRLLSVPGIGTMRVERIKAGWTEQKEIKNIMLFPQDHGVSTSHATKIYKTYGNESIKVVQENPYKLADDIWGIGFKTADTIAEKMGFGHEKYVRLRSGLMYTLNKLSEDGHCFATREQLVKTGCELLDVEDSVLDMTLDEMIRAKDVIIDRIPNSPVDILTQPSGGSNQTGRILTLSSNQPCMESQPDGGSAAYQAGRELAGSGATSGEDRAIYLPLFYYSEVGTAKRLRKIYNNPAGFRIETEGLAEKIGRITNMNYDEVQIQAIMAAVQSKVLILTGGPGTGKTTTTLGIITAFRKAGAQILLAAPTGRAAKRLSEATGMEAKTIHRLLEAKPPEGYQKNEEKPLEGDVLIVDECSMIDIMLMYNLLKAVPDSMTLILVGDIDQLPSVGAGNVLRDIIESQAFPVVRLTRIFRQTQTSRIIMNAHRRRMIMKRIMSFLLVAILLFGFSTIAESASEVPSAIDAQSGTDYANADDWAYFGIGEGRAADVFLICPTVDMKDEFNMSLEDEDTKVSFLGALNMERGIYEDTARLYAPYYRQAAMKVYSMEPYEREPWLALAYEDISAAFDWYLAHENAGRPIVLAGFSQGADMCYRLLEEYFGDEALYCQLIAVYAIGWPCTEEMTAQYPQIVSATGEHDLGVVVSFDCEAPEVTQTLITPAETRALTINPLNWKTDGTPADRSENLGACFTNYSGEIVWEEAGLCGCYIDERRGVVKVPDVDPADYPPIVPGLPEGAYHIYDYQFFFRNLQKNVADRTERFLQTGAPDEVAEETPVTK